MNIFFEVLTYIWSSNVFSTVINMVSRTLQYQNGSYIAVIPKALVDALGLNVGDKVSFRIVNEKIMIAPAETAKFETGAANDPVKGTLA